MRLGEQNSKNWFLSNSFLKKLWKVSSTKNPKIKNKKVVSMKEFNEKS